MSATQDFYDAIIGKRIVKMEAFDEDLFSKWEPPDRRKMAICELVLEDGTCIEFGADDCGEYSQEAWAKLSVNIP